MNTPEQIEFSIVKKYKKTIWHRFIKAGREYGLVGDGDRILCAVTGSDASLLFAKCFERLKKYSETQFGLSFIVPEKGNAKAARAAELAGIFGLDVSVIDSADDIAALVGYAAGQGYNKLALPDCFDDSVEHTLYSTLYNGSLETLAPKQTAGEVTVIRAGVLVRRSDIGAFMRYNGLPEDDDTVADNEKLALTRRVIAELSAKNPNLEINILRSCEDVNLETIISYIDSSGARHSALDNEQ